MIRVVTGLAACVVASGCALKGDVRRVETQLQQYREETARADSARAVMLARVVDQLGRLDQRANSILDSLQAQRLELFGLQGEMRGDLTEVQRQLITIQELSGQSQAQLNQLSADLERRATEARARPVPTETGDPTAPGDAPATDEPGPEELFTLGMRLMQRGSPATARTALRRLLDTHPDHIRAADALYQIGESFRTTDPDSATAAFEKVVEDYPDSPRAPLSLYKMALEAERRGEEREARLLFQRVVAGYPRSEEADLARAKLRTP